MHGKVRQLIVTLYSGNRSDSVFHILKHLREYAEVKARRIQVEVPHSHCARSERQHKYCRNYQHCRIELF